jgi:hypothetical protein
MEKKKRKKIYGITTRAVLSTLTLGSSTLPCTPLERSPHESEKRDERKRELLLVVGSCSERFFYFFLSIYHHK